jgi:hypothetical protein
MNDVIAIAFTMYNGYDYTLRVYCAKCFVVSKINDEFKDNEIEILFKYYDRYPISCDKCKK